MSAREGLAELPVHMARPLTIGLFFGTLAGVLGIGGGAITVPALNLFTGLSGPSSMSGDLLGRYTPLYYSLYAARRLGWQHCPLQTGKHADQERCAPGRWLSDRLIMTHCSLCPPFSHSSAFHRLLHSGHLWERRRRLRLLRDHGSAEDAHFAAIQ